MQAVNFFLSAGAFEARRLKHEIPRDTDISMVKSFGETLDAAATAWLQQRP